MSVNQRLGRPSCFFFSNDLKNTNLVEDVKVFLPVKFRWILSGDFREVENVSANQRPGRPSWIFDCSKNTNLVQDVEIVLPVKFRCILFSRFRGEVENVSANQRPGRPSQLDLFGSAPKHKLDRGRSDLASYQILLNYLNPFPTIRKCEKLMTTEDSGALKRCVCEIRMTRQQ